MALAERFHCREQTYFRKPPDVNDTGWRDIYFAARVRARRSFIKWCAKHGLVGKLVIMKMRSGGIGHFRAAGHHYGSPYRHGYPEFEASRSHPRELWGREFARHREAWIARAENLTKEASERERTAQVNRETVRRLTPQNRLFFKLLAAAGSPS